MGIWIATVSSTLLESTLGVSQIFNIPPTEEELWLWALGRISGMGCIIEKINPENGTAQNTMFRVWVKGSEKCFWVFMACKEAEIKTPRSIEASLTHEDLFIRRFAKLLNKDEE